MKVIIAGGRDFNDYELLYEKCESILSRVTEPIEIVSGCAEGADTLGERYANAKGYDVVLFPANWKAFGKYAGPIRNGIMADYADSLIAFWDGRSPGTGNMISVAKAAGLKVRVINY